MPRFRGVFLLPYLLNKCYYYSTLVPVLRVNNHAALAQLVRAAVL